MMMCGALHDIAEKSKELYTSRQIKEVCEQIEKLINFINNVPTQKFEVY
jgi:hypothetical protein